MRKLITIILLFLSFTASADTIGLHTWSRHAPAAHAWNNQNFGAYWRSDEGTTLGGYCNSYSGIGPKEKACNVTVYAA